MFLPGHHTRTDIAAAFWSTPGLEARLFVGEEAPRVGHAARDGRPYTHIGLRLFEVGGLRLMDQLSLPEAADPEMHLGRTLSGDGGLALFLFYDEERGAGGVARFSDGALAMRTCYDARGLAPLRRDLHGETVLSNLDPSDWIWAPASALIAAEAAPIVGPGIRDDDDIAALIQAADARPLPLPPSAAEAPNAPKRGRRRDRLKRWVKGWMGE